MVKEIARFSLSSPVLPHASTKPSKMEAPGKFRRKLIVPPKSEAFLARVVGNAAARLRIPDRLIDPIDNDSDKAPWIPPQV